MADIPIQGKFRATTVAGIIADAEQIDVNGTKLPTVLDSKEDIPGRSGALPADGALVKNTMYYLGVIKNEISITFPDNRLNGKAGDWLYFNYSTPPTNVPNVTVNTDHSIGLDLVDDWKMESCSYTAMAMWDGTKWVFAYRTIDIGE